MEQIACERVTIVRELTITKKKKKKKKKKREERDLQWLTLICAPLLLLL